MEFDWDAIADKWYWETEVLEGGGVIIHPDGTFEAAPDHYMDLSGGTDTTYIKDEVWYWADGDIQLGHFPHTDPDTGYTFKVIGESDVMNDAPFARALAESTGVLGEKDVFLGATSADAWDKDREATGEDSGVDEYGEPLYAAYYIYGPYTGDDNPSDRVGRG